jgi:hypothetical protein
VEDQEALETSALISQLADAVKYEIDDFLANGVVTTGIVVGSILLSSDELFWVKQLTVGSSTDLIDDGRLQIDEDGTWDVFASASLTEEGVERVISSSDGLVAWHLTVRLDTVLQAVQLPAGIAHLDSGLPDVDTDTFTHFRLFSGHKTTLKRCKNALFSSQKVSKDLVSFTNNK